jgi:hypothetical protein
VGWHRGIFWPYAYRDILGYSFGLHANGENFWTYAYNDLFAGIFWPPSYTESDADRASRHIGRSDRIRGQSDLAALSPEFARICNDQTPGLTAWPFKRIEQTVLPVGVQRAAFDDLKTASLAAAEQLRDSCPTEVPASPAARLEAIEKRLAAVIVSVNVVRPALESFYKSLDDEQKAHLDAIGASAGSGRGESMARSLDQMVHGNAAQSCGSEGMAKYHERTIRHIERVVRPTDMQRAALDQLKIAGSQAAETLRAACPRSAPLTPTGRLDAIQKRLEAMLQAIKAINPTLVDFYGTLSDEQKTRFNTMTSVRD